MSSNYEKFKRYREKHRERYRELNREWIANNRERYNAAKYNYRERLKLQALSRYSGGEIKCAVCGYSNPDALVLDHIENDGAEHRRSMKVSSRGNSGGCSTYQALKREGWPDGLQVLCANCNMIKQQELLRAKRMANEFYAKDKIAA